MSKPTAEQIADLEKCLGDAEAYHSTFDSILEDKLKELDPEWMAAMDKLYADSHMSRWCA